MPDDINDTIDMAANFMIVRVNHCFASRLPNLLLNGSDGIAVEWQQKYLSQPKRSGSSAIPYREGNR